MLVDAERWVHIQAWQLEEVEDVDGNEDKEAPDLEPGNVGDEEEMILVHQHRDWQDLLESGIA